VCNSDATLFRHVLGPWHDVQPPDQSGGAEAVVRLSLEILVPDSGAYPFSGVGHMAQWLVLALLAMLGGPTLLSGIQSKADLHCHLSIRNLVILEVAAHLGDLKPPHISDRLVSSRDRVVDCVFDAVWRGTDQLNLFVDMVTRKRIKPLHVASGEHIPRSKDVGHFSKGSNIIS